MRVFVAGASGVIGRRLVPMLVNSGHQVSAMTRSETKLAALAAAGADPVLADAMDASRLEEVVCEARPDAVIHELTAIPQKFNPRKIKRDFLANDRLRSEGTRNLVAATKASGARHLIAQGVAFIYAPGPPGVLHGEQDRLLLDDAPSSFKRTARALNELERAALDADGTVLRYGYFYGPGTWISPGGVMLADVRRRQLPIVGSGAGIWPFVHVDDAARATVAALAHQGPAVYNIVDDDPAPAREWIALLGRVAGAPKPLRIPALLARVVAGEYAVASMTRAQGASNARAKSELGWKPEHSSWREGFREVLG